MEGISEQYKSLLSFLGVINVKYAEIVKKINKKNPAYYKYNFRLLVYIR